MKKLMIAAAIVCAAAMSQASSWNWTYGTGSTANKTFYDIPAGTGAKLAENTLVYLFDKATISEDALLEAIRGGSTLDKQTSVTSTKIGSTNQMTAKEGFSYGEYQSEYTFYMAAIDAAGNLFLSGEKTATGLDSQTGALAFGATGDTKKNLTTDATKTYAQGGAGWYAVPEPTSGLLLLLGVAGLALRRRRA